MVDISNTNLVLNIAKFNDLKKAWDKFIKTEKREPNFVYYNSKDTISKARFKEMINRVNNFYKKNGRLPKTVTISPNNNIKLSTIAKGAIQKAIEKHLGSFDNYTKFYQKMSCKGYGNYRNDVLTLNQEITSLSNNTLPNCTDYSQMGYALAKEMGYTVQYVHIRCKSGIGHIILRLKGKELGNSWVYVDLAAKADKNSRTYALNDYWCKIGGKIESIDDAWLKAPDDGKM